MNAKLIAAALIISTITKNIWELTFPGLYFIGDSIAWLLFSFVIYRLSGGDYWLNRVSLVATWWCVSDLFDSILFDPYKSGWNEWISALVIIVLVFRKSKAKWQKQQRKRGGLL